VAAAVDWFIVVRKRTTSEWRQAQEGRVQRGAEATDAGNECQQATVW